MRLDAAVDWNSLRLILEQLLHQHADRLVRVKGLVHITGGAAPIIVQGAAGRLYPPVPVSAPMKEYRTRSGSGAKYDDPRGALGPDVLSESAR